MTIPVALCCMLLLVACAAGEPPREPAGLPVHAPRGVEAEGAARMAAGEAGGEPVLRATAVLRNHAADAVELTVLAACPLLVRLVPAGAAAPAYDERGRPCPRAGRTLRLASGAEQVLEREIPLSELRAAGTGAGRFRAILTVTAGADAFDVDAGEVTIP